MQSVTRNDAREAPVPLQQASNDKFMSYVMQEDTGDQPRGAFISEREAVSHEQETIREIAAQQKQNTVASLHVTHPCSSHTQTTTQDGSTSNDNACNYVGCLLCDTQTKYTFHTMQRKLFASKAFSPQAIYDTFYAV
jgi:hypothetical protein